MLVKSNVIAAASVALLVAASAQDMVVKNARHYEGQRERRPHGDRRPECLHRLQEGRVSLNQHEHMRPRRNCAMLKSCGRLELGHHRCLAVLHNERGSRTTPSATNPKLTTLCVANDNALVPLALHAANNLHLKKIAIIDDRTAYGQGVAEVFTATAKSKGIEIVDQQYTTDKATDFMAILTAIKSETPTACSSAAWTHRPARCCARWSSWVCPTSNFGGDYICTDKLIELSGGAKTLYVVCARARVAGQDAGRQCLEVRAQAVPGLFTLRVRAPCTWCRPCSTPARSTKVYSPKLAAIS